MEQSKIYLLSSLALILAAIALIILGNNSVTFTLASLAFIGSGMLYSKFQQEVIFNDFEEKLMNGEFASEEDGEIPQATIDVDDLSESDREVLSRIMGIDFDDEGGYTKRSEINQEETKV